MDGFNTRVDYKGASFIVQTQDKGSSARYVESLIYKSGRLLTSRRTFYTAFINSPNFEKILRQILDDQHAGIIEDIKQGKYERFLDAEEKA
jgi:hypothetical protein